MLINRAYSGASYCTVADAEQLPAGTERESAVTLGSIIAASTMMEAYLGGQALYRPVTRFTWTDCPVKVGEQWVMMLPIRVSAAYQVTEIQADTTDLMVESIDLSGEAIYVTGNISAQQYVFTANITGGVGTLGKANAVQAIIEGSGAELNLEVNDALTDPVGATAVVFGQSQMAMFHQLGVVTDHDPELPSVKINRAFGDLSDLQALTEQHQNPQIQLIEVPMLLRKACIILANRIAWVEETNRPQSEEDMMQLIDDPLKAMLQPYMV